MTVYHLGHHLLRLGAFFGVLFCIGLVAAMRERRRKMSRRRQEGGGA